MRLSRIYTEQSLVVGSKVQLDTTSNHYVRNVLRLKPDMSIALFNGLTESDFESTLYFDGKKTFASILHESIGNSESALESEIIQGLSRSDHLDWMIQKSTELGVRSILIFNGNHSQIPIKSGQLEKKQHHWRAIAIKACEQSGRHIPPQVNFFENIQQALKGSALLKNRFLLDFSGPRLGALLQSEDSATQVSILLGPEGGLSDSEITQAHAAGFLSSQIGPRVLRTETAAITALAMVQSFWGDI
ncbi:MAG: 16S rRNA (uracil1498-N3)-methyltransferase [Gammaproteobacteria bacterium]|jgi:16S rRNA (uracil1498-N3)-methyltransferase